MAQDVIIYPSGTTTNTNPHVVFSGVNSSYIIEMMPDGFLDISIDN